MSSSSKYVNNQGMVRARLENGENYFYFFFFFFTENTVFMQE